MPQQAVWRGLLEGFSQLISVFMKQAKTYSLNFSIKKQQKNLKTINAYTESTDLKTFKNIIHLVTQSL